MTTDTGAVVRAQVLTAPGTFETRHFPLPVVGDDDGILDVLACGLCGSDVASFLGTKDHGGEVILGHEVIGRISQLGRGAASRWGVDVGDRIAIEEALPCGACEYCRNGRQRVCTNFGIRYGDSTIDVAPALWGGFGERMYLHPNTRVHRVPEGVADDVATLFVPLSNGLAWLRDSGELRPGDSVVVFGAGQHGVATGLAALRLGARRSLVVGTTADRHRLDLAASFGCDVLAVDPDRSATEAVLTELGGYADVVVDMTPGTALPLISSIEIAKKGAHVLWGGLKRSEVSAPLPVDEIIRRELTVRGLWARPSWAITAAFEWLAADPSLAGLCERTCDAADLASAFRIATDPNASERPLHIAIVDQERAAS
ncbi:zinc-dependent alcohol dehydrogenase [Rhodococcus artemisiae]|uniref:Alcohol dehydrogenase catalytic domain-containing protein n=1 Tax=Rhodococcus artemisiae TaxID=714159 RepID=A0ABU7LFX7_9NOCA|nr:alcohol dehydrogenase catalytic domain-containing protein [Rhodococcus artemisiae]MEE2060415.1 alcohol dehydrogenase catalytic domain-containing protein [Rhodococcus artemisiae]